MGKIRDIDMSYISRTLDTIVSKEELANKLKEKRQLRIKYGVDVTAPFLHLGHAVNLWMMRHFQDCGHKVVFLIGDFTTQIGDPTGKSQLRKEISKEEIEKNAQEFVNQVSRVLNTDPNLFEVRRNSEWFGSMGVADFLGLTRMVTHAQLIQRDMFQKRISSNTEIYISEMLYPILQGYDSYAMQSDLTIVGTDQLFNEHMGRFFQEKFSQTPQIIITTKITPGIDGKEKQSKSLGNYIAITDTPRDMFGKIMSIPDNLICSYFVVYTDVAIGEIEELKKGMEKEQLNPMEAKKKLAGAVVERYYGNSAAQQEKEWFANAFSSREIPTDIPAIEIDKKDTLLQVLKKCLPQESVSELRRLIQQGAVRLNEEKVVDGNQILNFDKTASLKVGKRKWFQLQKK